MTTILYFKCKLLLNVWIDWKDLLLERLGGTPDCLDSQFSLADGAAVSVYVQDKVCRVSVYKYKF